MPGIGDIQWSLETAQVWDYKEVLRGEVSAPFVSFAVCADSEQKCQCLLGLSSDAR